MKIKNCPFCGHDLQKTFGEDTLHPSGTAWREDVGIIDDTTPCRHYIPAWDERGYHGLVYTLNCPENYGGCGVSMQADSEEEVIEKWNTRK